MQVTLPLARETPEAQPCEADAMALVVGLEVFRQEWSPVADFENKAVHNGVPQFFHEVEGGSSARRTDG